MKVPFQPWNLLLVSCDLIFLCIGFKEVDLVSFYLSTIYNNYTLGLASRKVRKIFFRKGIKWIMIMSNGS